MSYVDTVLSSKKSFLNGAVNLNTLQKKITYFNVSLVLHPVQMKWCTQKHLFRAVTTTKETN